MKRAAIVLCILVVAAAAGSVTVPSAWLAASGKPPVPSPASSGQIVQEPALESATDTSAIVRWVTNSIDGTAVRYGVVHYGIDPRHLDQTAKSQNRFNRGLPTMIYRVQLRDLEPGLTYYYSVEFTDAKGVSQGADSTIHQFATLPH